MARNCTPVQRNYPVPEDFVALANRLRPKAVDELLRCIWQGFDQLVSEEFDVTKEDTQLEDDISFAAYCRIQDSMPAYSPFSPIHQPREREHRQPTGMPPTSDLGFRMRGGNVRSHFTIEAKVVRTERAVSQYVSEVTDNLLTGRYSTFSSEAVMLGYLLSGTPDVTFDAIATSLRCALNTHPRFANKNQRWSDHRRNIEPASPPQSFRCHHLLILFAAAAENARN
jgi:hypothetical protein